MERHQPTSGSCRTEELKRLFATLTDDLASVNVRLERANFSFATALVATLGTRGIAYTAGHSAAVAIYVRDIAAGVWA